LAEGRVAPVAATVLVLGLGRCPLGLALGGEPDRLAVLVDDRVVLAGRDLVPTTPVVSALLRETQVPLSPSWLSSFTADSIGSRDGAVLLLSTRRAGPQASRRSHGRAATLRGVGLRTGLGERLGRPRGCLRRLDRPLLVEADDLGEMLGGEAVAAAHPGVRYQAPSRSVLGPPGRAAEGVGDLLGAVEAGRRGVGRPVEDGRGRGSVQGGGSWSRGRGRMRGRLRWRPCPGGGRGVTPAGLRRWRRGRRYRIAAWRARWGTGACWA